MLTADDIKKAADALENCPAMNPFEKMLILHPDVADAMTKREDFIPAPNMNYKGELGYFETVCSRVHIIPAKRYVVTKRRRKDSELRHQFPGQG